jgi:subtilisin-like proprotein convertase family protein
VLVPGPTSLEGSALTQQVRNVGDESSAGGTATLTGADGPRTYPSIDAGEAATSDTPFTVSLPAGAACGDPIDLRLALAGAELPLRLAAGAAGTRVYANTAPVAVPDVGSATSAVTVGAVGPVWDVNVRLDRVVHEFAADLTLELIAPDGAVVRLADRRGGNGQDLDRTLFDDQALVPVGEAEAPFNAQLRPEQPLGGLNRRAAQGEWKLRVTDRAKGEAGVIEGWSLELIADDCDRTTADPEPGGTGPQTAANGGSGTSPGPGSDGGAVAGDQRPPAGPLRLPALSLRAAPISARRFAAHGVRARIGCPDPCRFRLELRLDPRTATRLGLPRRHVRTGWRNLPAGEHTTLRLRPRGARRFRRAGRGARLTVRLITADGRTVERAFRLRRR